MANERRYTRIPPESTGDRVQMNYTVDVRYENRTGTWVSGSLVSCPISGFRGTIVRIRDDTATTGLMSLRPERNSEDNNITPQVGETLELDGVFIGNIAAGTPLEIYTPVQKIVGWDGTYNGLNIDKQGAANTRYTEGAPTIDAFGSIRTSQTLPIGDYVFAQSILENQFSTTTTGGGSIIWNSDQNAAIISTTGANGDSIEHVSDQYHHSIPGQSQLAIMTVAAGDTGKPNLVRCWGYFDNNNGAFFRLAGSTLSIVIRSSVSGTPIDTIIDQNLWNADNGTGTGGEANTTGLNINVDNVNVYWIDTQGINGRIRFGIYYEGQRLVLHEVMVSNFNNVPAFKTTRLPIKFEQRNTGAVGSISEMRVWSSAVFIESEISLNELGSPSGVSGGATVAAIPQTLVLAIRPNVLLPNGNPNHNLYFPVGFNVGAYDPVAATPSYIKMEVYFGGDITGGTWATQFGKTAEVNSTGTVSTFGVKLSEWYVNGTGDFDIEESFTNAITGAVRNKSNGEQALYFFVATRLYGTNDIEVGMSVQWKEVEN